MELDPKTKTRRFRKSKKAKGKRKQVERRCRAGRGQMVVDGCGLQLAPEVWVWPPQN